MPWRVIVCTLAVDRGERLLRRVGVDERLPVPRLRLPLDAEAEEVEALVDVADPRLLLRQAQAHRGEHRCHLVAQRLGVRAGAGDHAPRSRPRSGRGGRWPALARRRWRVPLGCPAPAQACGEVLVEDGQGDVGQQR